MTRPRDSTGMPLYCDVTLADLQAAYYAGAIDGQRNPTAVPEALMRAAEGWVKLTIIAKDVVPQIEAAIARLDA